MQVIASLTLRNVLNAGLATCIGQAAYPLANAIYDQIMTKERSYFSIYANDPAAAIATLQLRMKHHPALIKLGSFGMSVCTTLKIMQLKGLILVPPHLLLTIGITSVALFALGCFLRPAIRPQVSSLVDLQRQCRERLYVTTISPSYPLTITRTDALKLQGKSPGEQVPAIKAYLSTFMEIPHTVRVSFQDGKIKLESDKETRLRPVAQRKGIMAIAGGEHTTLSHENPLVVKLDEFQFKRLQLKTLKSFTEKQKALREELKRFMSVVPEKATLFYDPDSYQVGFTLPEGSEPVTMR